MGKAARGFEVMTTDPRAARGAAAVSSRAASASSNSGSSEDGRRSGGSGESRRRLFFLFCFQDVTSQMQTSSREAEAKRDWGLGDCAPIAINL